MWTFIYIALGVLAGIIIAPLVLWVFFRYFLLWFVRKLAKAFEGMGDGVPPFRLILDPDDEIEWLSPEVIDAATAELEQLGYQRAGDYRLNTPPLNGARGFAHEEGRFYAVIYDWPEEMNDLPCGPMADVVARFEGGEALTVSNTFETSLDEPPWSEHVRLDRSLSDDPSLVRELHQTAVERTSGREKEPVGTSGFALAFKRAYAREKDWHIERGGLNREEIRRNILVMEERKAAHQAEAGKGKKKKKKSKPLTEEQIEEAIDNVQEGWRRAIDDFVSAKTEEMYIKHGAKMPAAEWERVRDRLYVVHEHSLNDRLKDHLSEFIAELETPEDDDGDGDAYEQRQESAEVRLAPHFEGKTPREAFAAAQAVLPEDSRYRRLAKIRGPWPADIYVEPEQPEYDSLDDDQEWDEE